MENISKKYKETEKKIEQENNSIAVNVSFASYNSEKIKLAYKSNHNKRKNH